MNTEMVILFGTVILFSVFAAFVRFEFKRVDQLENEMKETQEQAIQAK